MDNPAPIVAFHLACVKFTFLKKFVILIVTKSKINPKSSAQLARHTCFHQANKKIFSTPPLQSPTQPSTTQRADPPPQQQRDMHML
jgi:hypothetical protein